MMQPSQDIGNVRRELILKVLRAQRTEICPPVDLAGTHTRRQPLEKNGPASKLQKNAIEGLKVAA